MNRHDFEPGAARAQRLSSHMHAGLGQSLAYLCDEAHGKIAFDEPAVRGLADRLRSGERHLPALFGRYYDLVPALADGRRDDAERLFREIACARPAAELMVMPMEDPRLDGVSDLYRSKLDTDSETRFQFLAPPAELVAPFTDRFWRAMELIEQVIPELAGEVRGLLTQVVLAVGPKESSYVFDGGSSYMLWGGLFLNAQFHQTRIEMAEVIAHETGHVLLFGCTVDEALTLNDEDERYKSPLRVDPRPMEGIYHATFVSARMHLVMTRLAESGLLDEDERKAALEAAVSDARNFWSGYSVVEEHGVLTDTGAGLMAGAHRYMQATM